MIEIEKAKYSAASGIADLLAARTNGEPSGGGTVSIQSRRHNDNLIGVTTAERWKTSMTAAYVPAPCAATRIFRAAWRAPVWSGISRVPSNVVRSTQNAYKEIDRHG
jgi:hypothetical protein